MTKIQHPTINRIQLDVASSTIDDWLAMGWLLIDASPPPPDIPRTPLTAGFNPKAPAN